MGEPESASTGRSRARERRPTVEFPRARSSLRARSGVRLRGLAAICSGALLAGCGSSRTPMQSGTSDSSAARRPPRTTIPQAVALATLRPTVAGALPAPVQDPATTTLGGHALLVGGLDSADASVGH